MLLPCDVVFSLALSVFLLFFCIISVPGRALSPLRVLVGHLAAERRQSSQSHHPGESPSESGRGRAWHAVFNPDRPQNQVQHVRYVHEAHALSHFLSFFPSVCLLCVRLASSRVSSRLLQFHFLSFRERSLSLLFAISSFNFFMSALFCKHFATLSAQIQSVFVFFWYGAGFLFDVYFYFLGYSNRGARAQLLHYSRDVSVSFLSKSADVSFQFYSLRLIFGFPRAFPVRFQLWPTLD